MGKVAGLAIGLALASTAVVTTAAVGDGQDVRISKRPPDRVDVIVDQRDEALPRVRRLAVLSGRGVQLGVSVRDLDAEQQKTTSGALVEDVRAGSAAEKAGIQKGDVITEFDGERVRGARHLSRLVTETPEGRTVTAGLLRDGRPRDVSVTPESGALAWENGFEELLPPQRFERLPRLERDDDVRGQLERAWPAFPDVEEFKRFGEEFKLFGYGAQPRLGIRVQELSPQLAEYFGTNDGVLVSSVETDSPAAKAGLRAGDVVTAVNGKAVTSSSELVEAVRSTEEELTIDYMRDKKAGSTKATLEKPEKKEKAPARRSVRPI
jgi:serine protease Do